MADIANDDKTGPPHSKPGFGDACPMPATQDTDVPSREAQLAEANTPEAKAAAEQLRMMLEMMDNEDAGAFHGPKPSPSMNFTSSQPDGNTIKIRFVRPEGDVILCHASITFMAAA